MPRKLPKLILGVPGGPGGSREGPWKEFDDFFNEFIEEFIKKSTSQAGQPGISQPSQDSEGTTAGEKDNKEKQNNYILKKSKLPINRFSGPILLD